MNTGMQDQEFLKTLSVLYVEDDADTRSVISIFLVSHVGAVYSANNGTDGLEVFIKNRPQIVITDIHMPVMDGLKLAEKLRGIDQLVPIILMTANDGLGAYMRAANINVVRYINKPFVLDRLLESLYECAQLISVNQYANDVHALTNPLK